MLFYSRLSIRILKELLLTYTEADAGEAKGYAEKLILLVVSDPTYFVFDEILELEPVKTLENEKIHNVHSKGLIKGVRFFVNILSFLVQYG